MSFDFDTPIDRRGTNSYKWNVQEGELPMWVADMDFAAAPCVLNALQRKLDTKVFGYQCIPDDFAQAASDWWRTRHAWAVEPEWVVFCTGVIPAVTSCVKRLTNVGDNVVLLTPVYDIFFHSVLNTGRHLLPCPLVYQSGVYSVDWRDLEEKLAHPQTTLMILCNPHNPTGHAWSEQELRRIDELCARHGVAVLSDEIHCDLTLPGVHHIPFGTVAQKSKYLVCGSASKAFNLAGLQGAFVIVPDKHLRQVIERGLNADEVAEPNAFAIDASVAAWREGAPWLDALRTYLAQNRATVTRFLAQNVPEVVVVEQQATYLMWLDVSAYCQDSTLLAKHIRQSTGLFVTAGAQYGGNGQSFLRLNIACPAIVLQDGLARLHKGILSYRV